uniref:BHLH domain-containing protein n=2 Tax=Hanusia phi TaxID=3032 RepID=A0A7S0E9F0_9CRYP|mmetsp:Transcript_18540/g.42284  ORF Transcript_18540/g.42284 Transcript_18540/m.42284 type:complete len:561 (+) Transcript_18540:588-2270(+)
MSAFYQTMPRSRAPLPAISIQPNLEDGAFCMPVVIPKKRGRKPKPIAEMQAKRRNDDRDKKRRKRDKINTLIKTLDNLVSNQVNKKQQQLRPRTLNEVLQAVVESVKDSQSMGHGDIAGAGKKHAVDGPSEGVKPELYRESLLKCAGAGYLSMDASFNILNANSTMVEMLIGNDVLVDLTGTSSEPGVLLQGQNLCRFLSEKENYTLRCATKNCADAEKNEHGVFMISLELFNRDGNRVLMPARVAYSQMKKDAFMFSMWVVRPLPHGSEHMDQALSRIMPTVTEEICDFECVEDKGYWIENGGMGSSGPSLFGAGIIEKLTSKAHSTGPHESKKIIQDAMTQMLNPGNSLPGFEDVNDLERDALSDPLSIKERFAAQRTKGGGFHGQYNLVGVPVKLFTIQENRFRVESLLLQRIINSSFIVTGMAVPLEDGSIWLHSEQDMKDSTANSFAYSDRFFYEGILSSDGCDRFKYEKYLITSDQRISSSSRRYSCASSPSFVPVSMPLHPLEVQNIVSFSGEIWDDGDVLSSYPVFESLGTFEGKVLDQLGINSSQSIWSMS